MGRTVTLFGTRCCAEHTALLHDGIVEDLADLQQGYLLRWTSQRNTATGSALRRQKPLSRQRVNNLGQVRGRDSRRFRNVANELRPEPLLIAAQVSERGNRVSHRLTQHFAADYATKRPGCQLTCLSTETYLDPLDAAALHCASARSATRGSAAFRLPGPTIRITQQQCFL